MNASLMGKTYVVTGATSGIGLATAEALASREANVIGVGRSSERCRAAEQSLRNTYPRSRISYLVADLALQVQVRRLAKQVQELLQGASIPYLDGLVNNAGVFTYWYTLTPEGFETQWAVNHLAVFLLTHELLPLLQAAPHGRVVTVSSGSHFGAHINWSDPQLRRHYNGLRAYGQSKLANVLFTLGFNQNLGNSGSLHAFAADPGLVKTDMGSKGTPPIVRWVWERRRSGGTDASVPARGIVYLLTEDSIENASEIYWLGSKPKMPSRQALDMASAQRLWVLSERMCGIPITD